MTRLDRAWLAKHPLPAVDAVADKNERGRVLVVGGSTFVPGALRLTGEAALRVGAGKLQLATVQSAALALGVLVPEAAMIALPHTPAGEIAPDGAGILAEAIRHADAVVIGPGTMAGSSAVEFLEGLLEGAGDGLSIVLDAGSIAAAPELETLLVTHPGYLIMTPHHGEMAALSGRPASEIGEAPEQIAREMADRFNAVIVLKASRTVIAAAGAEALIYEGDCPGLATGGSGDVLAGLIGGLAARGTDALTASAYGVWLHGEAGRTLARAEGGVGFLARDLAVRVPAILEAMQSQCPKLLSSVAGSSVSTMTRDAGFGLRRFGSASLSLVRCVVSRVPLGGGFEGIRRPSPCWNDG